MPLYVVHINIEILLNQNEVKKNSLIKFALMGLLYASKQNKLEGYSVTDIRTDYSGFTTNLKLMGYSPFIEAQVKHEVTVHLELLKRQGFPISSCKILNMKDISSPEVIPISTI